MSLTKECREAVLYLRTRRLEKTEKGQGTEPEGWAEEGPKWMGKNLLFVWDFCYPGRGLHCENDPAGGLSHVKCWERQKTLVKGN